MIKSRISKGAAVLLLTTMMACGTVQTTFEPVGDGRISVEYTQGTPSIGMCGFYTRSYYYEIDFLDISGHYSPKNLRLRNGTAGSKYSKIIDKIEGTVELNRATSEIRIQLFELKPDGQRVPLVINGRHTYVDKRK